jgi:O-antigen/teichoic acid export membrane protein
MRQFPALRGNARARLERLRTDSLARNSAMIAAATASTSALGYVYWVLAARLFPAASVGAASALVSAMSLVSTVAIVGGQSALVERLPSRRTQRDWCVTVTTLVVLTATLSLLGSAITLVVLPLLDPDQQLFRGPAAIGLFVVAVVATTASTLADFAWIAERRAGVMLAFNVLFAAAKVVLVVVLSQLTSGPTGVVAAWTLSCCVATTGSWLVARRIRGFRFVRGDWRSELRALRRCLAGHHVVNLAIVAPTLVLPIVAASRMTTADAAYLYAAWRIGGFFVLLASAVGSALFAEGSHDPSSVGVRARSSVRMLLPLLAVSVLGVVLLRDWILLLFGPEYRDRAATALLLLSLAAIPEAAVSVASAVLRVQRRLRTAAGLLVGIAAVEILLAAWAMPRWGVTGSAAVALGVQLLGCLAMGAALLASRSTDEPLPPEADRWHDTPLRAADSVLPS